MTNSELGPSSLELAYDFEDLNFRAYMTGSKNWPDDLRRFVDGMAEAEHPLVRSAAGWAAEDLALCRAIPSTSKYIVTMPERIAALQVAQQCWETAKEDMPAFREQQSTPESNRHIRYTEVHLLQSLAYLPLMGIGASMFAGEPLNKDEVHERQQKTQQSSLAVAGMILDLPANTPEYNIEKTKLVGEALCGLLGQSDPAQQYLILPASLRRKRHPREAVKADLLAISTYQPHPRTLIGVETHKSNYKGRRLTLYPQKDFIIDRDGSPQDTLQAFSECAADTAKPETLIVLAMLARLMTLRLDKSSSISRE